MEFTLQHQFSVAPQKVFKSWLSSEGHSEMTGGEASISDQIGTEFSSWDGYIWGKNLEIIPNQYIKQSWQTSDFEDGQEASTVEISLSTDEKGCLLTLRHSNLREADDHYIKGWEDHYFTPMDAYFS